MPRAPMPRPTPWPRAALAALFMAFALTTLAPDNAAAQERDPNPLELGAVSGFNLDLIWPVTATDGKTYYFLDRSGDGIATGRVTGQEAVSDTLTTGELKTLLNNGDDVTATQDGNHDGSDDARSVLASASGSGLTYTLVLPTIAEFDVVQALSTKTAPNRFDSSQPDLVGGSPPNWLDGSRPYATANISMGGEVDNFYYYLDEVGMSVPNFPSSAQDDSSGVSHLAIAFQVIAPTAPDAPTGVTATNGNGQSVVTWTPANSGGSAVLSYTATASPDGTFIGADATCSTTDTTTATPTCTITGLTNGTVYEITVVATNAVGTSDPSGGDVTASPGIPGTPTGVTLTAGNEQIVVEWTPVMPANNGGSAILGYDARPFDGGLVGSSICTVDGADADTCTITGLTNGTQYRVVVRARNAHGYSISSPNEFATPSFLRFSETVAAAQTFSVGQTVALTLSEATGGLGTYVYTLTPDAIIPDGLTFDGATRTLSGIPTTPATVPTLQYTVTDDTTNFVRTFSVTIVAAPELVLMSQTVADRTYPVMQRTGGQSTLTDTISTVILPRATGGLGRLNYELSPLPSDGISGLGYTPASRTIWGTPARVQSQVFTYTVTDRTAPDAQTVSLTFKISVVDVQGDGTIVTDTDGTALAVNDVGTTGHNLRLFLPDGHTATTFTVTTYTPESATAPVRYIFSDVAMDIDLRPGSATSIPETIDEATVCLSTAGVPTTNHAPALFLGTTSGAHVQGTPDGWVNIGSEIRTRGGDEYVCGETREFAPYFAVAYTSTVPDIVLTPTALTFAEGSTTTYTVVLAALPTADVTVTITGPTGAEVTPTPAVLTFTTGDWSTAQTVTLTPAADADAVDEADVTLTHTANGGNYVNVTGNVTVTVTDDDTAGLTLTPGALTFDEEGTATYTVALATEPSVPVTVTITGHATTVLATTPPNPNPLTFTTRNWNTPQTVTLTAAEDDDTTNDSVTLMHTAAGGEYGNVTGDMTNNVTGDVTVTITDTDVPGLMTPRSLTVVEGGTATYTVRLTIEPDADVTVAITVPEGSAGLESLSSATLTFTPTNYDEPQNVVVTASDNDIDAVDGGATLAHTATSGSGNYMSGVAVRNLDLTITDDDTRGLTLTPRALTFDESGTATYTAVLASEPTATVTVRVDGFSGTDVVPTPTVLTFTTLTGMTGAWDMAQTVTLTATEDSDTMDEDPVTLMHTADGGDYGTNSTDRVTATLPVTVTDNDLAFRNPGTIENRTLTLNIHQTFTLSLPTVTNGEGIVTYTLERLRLSNDPDALPLAPGLSFDPTPTTPTISGVPTKGFGPATVAYKAIDSASPAKTGNLIFEYSVVDRRGITLSRTDVTLTEEDTDTYTVVLNSQPTAPVTVTIASENTYVTTNPTSLSFTTGNWNTARTVTINTVDDMNMMNDAPVMLTHTAAGGDYTPALSTASNLAVTVIDDDIPNLTLTPNTLMLDEGGSGRTHEVALTTTPSAAVTVTITGHDNTDVTPTPAVLTFAANDSLSQTVTLAATEDNDAMNESATLTYTASGGASGTYNGVIGTVKVTVTDNDAPLMFSATSIADRIYPFFDPNVAIPPLTLPEAEGGTNTGTLMYTLVGAPAGLSFADETLTLSGTPTAAASASLTYTVIDSGGMLNDSLTFSVSVVTVIGDGTAVPDGDGTALAVNDVGTTDHNLRLLLPDGHIVNRVEATTYTPTAGTELTGYTFSGVAMDIDLRPASADSIPDNTEATVCLATTDVPPGHTPALFLGGVGTDGTGWENIGSDTTTRNGFVCGTTRNFAPYFAVASTPTAPGDMSDLSFASTVSDRIYPVDTDITLTLPVASGGTAPLMYNLIQTQTPSISGLLFNNAPTTRTLSGILNTSASLVYTATDSGTPRTSVSLTFSVSVVEVMLPGDGAYESVENGAALAVNNVGGEDNNDVLLSLSGGLAAAPTLTVTTYTPDAAPVLAAGYAFSGVAVDIALPNFPGDSTATVCLSTVGVPAGHNPALFHDTSGAEAGPTWTNIGEDDTTRPGFVCGNTSTFSPFIVGSRAASADLNEQILSRASQAMTASVSARVAARVEAAAGSGGIDSAGDPSALAYQFGGQSSMRDLLQAHGKTMLEGGMDYERLLEGASFVLPLSAAGEEGGGKLGALSLWGGADFSNLDGDTDNLDWDGELVSFHLGVDTPVGNNMLAGLALSHNTASFDFTHEGRNGDYDYTTTNLHPYFGYMPNDKLNFWGAAGFGEGEIEIEADGGAEKTDADYLSLAGGFSTHLRDLPGLLPDSVISLNVKGDASVVQVDVDAADGINAQEVSSNHIRLLLAGEHRRELAGGGLLAPSMEVGVRYDGGDGETGSGVEIGTGLRYAHGKLTLNGNVRGLLLEDYDEWGADFTVRLAPQSGRGLSLSLQPVWGQTQSTAERLWDDGAGELGGGDTALQSRMDSEVGYGLAATMLGSAGVLTPYAGMTTADGGVSHLRLGSRFAGGDGLSLNLEGARGNSGDDASHTVLLRGELAF